MSGYLGTLGPELADVIDAIWKRSSEDLDVNDRWAVDEVIALIDKGTVRAAEPRPGGWAVVPWVKKALDLYYRSAGPTVVSEAGPLNFRDRFPLKAHLEEAQIRVAPPGAARYGSFFSPGVTLMSCYVHLGTWIGRDSLIDSWVAIGTCAQIGDRVKILPCTSIAGSLYPLEASPTVIEDDCHIGSGCVVGPGARVGRGAILGSGVTISPSSPVVDVRGAQQVVLGTEVPEDVIVISGSIRGLAGIPSQASVGVALVIGNRDPALTPHQNLEQGVRKLGLGGPENAARW